MRKLAIGLIVAAAVAVLTAGKEECGRFEYGSKDIDLTRFAKETTVIMNDDGSYVALRICGPLGEEYSTNASVCYMLNSKCINFGRPRTEEAEMEGRFEVKYEYSGELCRWPYERYKTKVIFKQATGGQGQNTTKLQGCTLTCTIWTDFYSL